MTEEHDRISSSSSSESKKRIRLFLFPTKPESAPSSIGSLLDDSKSENWFVDALNGAIGVGIEGLSLPSGVSVDSASLLALKEDPSSVNSRAGPALAQPDPDPDRRVAIPRPDSSGKLTRQDVHSVPDSPMMETNSSFGSTSSGQVIARAEKAAGAPSSSARVPAAASPLSRSLSLLFNPPMETKGKKQTKTRSPLPRGASSAVDTQSNQPPNLGDTLEAVTTADHGCASSAVTPAADVAYFAEDE